MERAQPLRSCQFAAIVIVALLATALLTWAQIGRAQPTANDAWPLGTPVPMHELEAVIAAQIADANVAGAVVAIGDASGVRERVALGQRFVGNTAEPMTEDTIFDLASLTKAVATATAVLQLAERGRLALDAPASRYWPAFAEGGKARITVRQLLNHTSGLPPGLAARSEFRGPTAVLHAIGTMPPVAEPGRRVIYSDLNYVALGEVVQRVSGTGLDAWCAQNIFRPLGMPDTAFRPGHKLITRIAPTIMRNGRWLRGSVHDPTAAALGGVSGNAGLFSTANDLARFARMLLNGGRLGDRRILQPDSVALLLTPDSSTAVEATRTLGWEAQAPLIPNRYRAPRAGLLLHLGYTGTGLWIDLVTRRFVIVLTSRLYPDEQGNAMPLREAVVNLVSSTAPPVSGDQIAARAPAMAEAVISAGQRLPMAIGPVRSGIDVLEASGFASLVGKRVGLVTNHSGFDAQGRRTIDVLSQAPGVRLNAIFAPEHGIGTDLDSRFGDTIDTRSNVVVHSLYGNNKGIPRSALAEIDVLVFDLQDAGVRFFTYLATLGATLEAAATAHIPVLVLDRPNPMGGDLVGGPVSDTADRSLTNYVPLPLVHGMTIGELARLLNDQLHIGAALQVVAMEQYDRAMRFANTGLGWVPPSPNLRDFAALERYPDVGLIEGASISVGRGTSTPFGIVGAPWMDGVAVARELNALDTGATYTPVHFVPAEGPYHGRSCSGVAIHLVSALTRPGRIGLALARVLSQRYPEHFKLEAIRTSVGSETVWAMLRDGVSLDAIERAYVAQVDAFLSQRAAYLLY
ncbi:Putative D-alanyl-D-alanine carboxypeptidase [Ralstonia psammae]|uniref:D-alanyl-D-alanine carboxypeptidase n=1 Tax=Ralstonia psammae TaxID=3058598 RepID=A0ABN9J9V5_9RALS|nr:exo-beta-N-acetylmuramidase NamZ domain-containing protein [Ralstonia sp. LMG 19083]CAJ0800072.1 Putative D-alanyl-D-alanine carboxypeptidase [Ralstonia sp. LMG 19083]